MDKQIKENVAVDVINNQSTPKKKRKRIIRVIKPLFTSKET